MNRRSLFFTLVLALSLALLGFACGSSDEGDGGPKKEPEPTAPSFKGLDEARSSRQGQGAAVRLFWWPAKNAPANDVKYTVRVWSSDPSKPRAPAPEVEDATPKTLPCPENSRCSLTWTANVEESVRWFSVDAKIVVADDEGGERELESESGVVLPAVIWLMEPEVTAVEPLTAGAGEVVIVSGGHFLDEPTYEDALMLGELAIPSSAIGSWNNREIRFTIPADAVSGPIRLKTIAGEAVSSTSLEVH